MASNIFVSCMRIKYLITPIISMIHAETSTFYCQIKMKDNFVTSDCPCNFHYNLVRKLFFSQTRPLYRMSPGTQKSCRCREVVVRRDSTVDSMLSCVCSVLAIDQRRRQNLVRTSVTHSAIACTFFFSPHFDVIFDLLLNRRMATWNLLIC